MIKLALVLECNKINSQMFQFKTEYALMKTMKNVSAYLFSAMVLLLPSIGFSKIVDVLAIKSSVDGDKEAQLKIELTSDNKILNVRYKNKPELPERVYPVQDLVKDPAAIVKKGPVSVVEFMIENVEDNSFVLGIRYLYQFNLFSKSDRRIKKIKINYNAKADKFVLTDIDTGSEVKKAFTHVRIENGKQKGIESIETL